MSVYFLPALISLLFKLIILAVAMRGGKVSTVFLSLIVIFAFHNAIELIGYFMFLNGHDIDIFFRPYYVASIFMATYVLLHGLALSGLNNKYSTLILLTLATSLSIVSLYGDAIVAGQYSIGYSATAVEGPYYWVFALYVPIVLLSNVAVLTNGYKRAETQLDSIRCAYSLVALAPLIITFSVAIIFKLADSGLNAAGIVPVATTLFLIIVLKSESQHKLSDVRRFLPFSLERKTSSKWMSMLIPSIKRTLIKTYSVTLKRK